MTATRLSPVSDPDFWHKYDDSTPSEAPELPQWHQVWIFDPDLGVNVGFWTGNAFRLYDKTSQVRPTHWAQIERPAPPQVEKSADGRPMLRRQAS